MTPEERARTIGGRCEWPIVQCDDMGPDSSRPRCSACRDRAAIASQIHAAEQAAAAREREAIVRDVVAYADELRTKAENCYHAPNASEQLFFASNRLVTMAEKIRARGAR